MRCMTLLAHLCSVRSSIECHFLFKNCFSCDSLQAFSVSMLMRVKKRTINDTQYQYRQLYVKEDELFYLIGLNKH